MNFSLKIQNKIRSLPEAPGIYCFKNKKGEVIYVGKAVNLRKRVNSYYSRVFQKNSKLSKMISEIYDVMWQEASSEIEALIKESQLIKHLQPFYNVLMRDDKKYFYLVFSQDIFPRVSITHQPPATRSFALGPFTHGLALKNTLASLRKVIPFCTCRNSHQKPCLSAQLGLCPGYCCLKENLVSQQKIRILKKDYHQNLKRLGSLLSGKATKVLKSLEKEMIKQGLKENFEAAQKIKEQAEALKNILLHENVISSEKKAFSFPIHNVSRFKKLLRLKKIPQRIEAYDISNLRGTMATGSMIVFGPKIENQNISFISQKKEYRSFHIRQQNSQDDLLMLKEVLKRRINHLREPLKKIAKKKISKPWPAPQLVLIDGGKNHLKVASKEFKKAGLSSKKIALFSLAKKQEKLYTVSVSQKKEYKIAKSYFLNQLPVEITNLFKGLRNEAHRFAVKHHRILRKKSVSR